MCDVDRYTTGVLLVQISAGMLASVFFATATVKSAQEDLPVAETVDVAEAQVVNQNIEEGAPAVPDAGAAPLRGEQSLRRRAVPEPRSRSNSDYRTIQMSAAQAQSMRFDF